MNIQECKSLIASADMCGHVPLISGPHGIGKSEIASQYSKENDLHFECLILSLMDTGDMLGMPVTKEIGGMTATAWAAPSWYNNIVNAAWPKDLKVTRLQFKDPKFQEHVMASLGATDGVDRGQLNSMYCSFYGVPEDRVQLLRQDNVAYLDSKRSVLFLDEFNRALVDILNASLQLILDHKMHTHELPVVRGQETLIVAAVNPSDGNYTVQEFDPAMYDRFVIGEAEADFKAWTGWAKNNNVNKIVRDFLMDNQKKFHFTPADGSKGASPRSWTRLATYIDRLQDNSMELNTDYVKGTVGSSLAAQFITYYNNYSNSMTTKELEKRIKEEIANASEEDTVVEIAAKFEDIVLEMDAIKRQEFAETYASTYIMKKTAKAFMPFLVYMYALPLESLSSVLKGFQTDNKEGYKNLAAIDGKVNKKGLFVKIISKRKADS